VRILDLDQRATPESAVEAHVALPASRPTDRAFMRLNMISSVDGGTAVEGVSGGLGNRDDHAVFAALREQADGCIVGLGTVIAEQYKVPVPPDLQLYVVSDTNDVSGAEELFSSGRATLVVPTSVGPVPDGVPELRAGDGEFVDLQAVSTALAGQVLVAEGGPTLAGLLAAQGLLDVFFVTIAPRVIAGSSARVAHGPDADASLWELEHGFLDDDGFLFLRYCRCV
jgi:5-amino-6-(5-phosphoribosylamino)uracil reductase